MRPGGREAAPGAGTVAILGRMERGWNGAPGRIRATVVTALLVGALALVVAPGARAVEGSSLQQQVEAAGAGESTTTPTTATTATTETTSNSHKTILIAMAAAVVLLSGIGFVIVRDARRVAPATEAEISEPRSARNTAVMMRRRRAKAKAARVQRRRNR